MRFSFGVLINFKSVLTRGPGSFTFIHYPSVMGGSTPSSGTSSGFLSNAVNLQLYGAAVASSVAYTVPTAASPYTAVITPYLPQGIYTVNQVIEAYMGTLEGDVTSAYPYGEPLYASTEATGATLLKETCLLCHTVVGYNGITASSLSTLDTAVVSSGGAVAPYVLNAFLYNPSSVSTPI